MKGSFVNFAFKIGLYFKKCCINNDKLSVSLKTVRIEFWNCFPSNWHGHSIFLSEPFIKKCLEVVNTYLFHQQILTTSKLFQLPRKSKRFHQCRQAICPLTHNSMETSRMSDASIPCVYLSYREKRFMWYTPKAKSIKMIGKPILGYEFRTIQPLVFIIFPL